MVKQQKNEKLLNREAGAVSVVIPSYQRHKEVIRAVKSALDQTLSPLEVIVANDGPDQEKGRLLESLNDKRIRFIEAPKRGKPSAIRNYGIQHAKGDWVALLDDDDIWFPQKLENQFKTLKKSQYNTAILSGKQRVIRPSGKSFYRPSSVDNLDQDVSVYDIIFSSKGGVHTSTIMAPKEIFKKYPYDEKWKRGEDHKWLLEAGQVLPLIISPNIVSERHITPGEGLSRAGGFDYCWQWYIENQGLMPKTVKARFIKQNLVRRLAYDKEFQKLPWLLEELRQLDVPRAYILFKLIAFSIEPLKLGQLLRKTFRK